MRNTGGAQKRRRPRFGEGPSGSDNIGCWDAGDPRSALRRIRIEGSRHSLKPGGVIADEGEFVQTVLDDQMLHRIEQCDVGARCYPQPKIGLVRHVGHPRISNDQLRPAGLGLQNMLGNQRMTLGRVRTND